MKTKHINRIFAAGMILHVILELLLVFTPLVRYIPWNIKTNIFLSECTLWIPVLAGALLCRTKLSEYCHIKRVKPSILLMTVLFTVLIDPLAILANSVSMLFVENTVAGLTEQILRCSFGSALFFIAIYGPFVEELLFRGVLFRGYRRAAGARWAIFLSALLFGLMHMNLNQAMYAFVIGVCLALLCEATDSLLPSFLVHFLFNAKSVCIQFLFQNAMASPQMDQAMTQVNDKEILLTMISVLCVMVVIETPLAICTLIWIAKRSDRLEHLKALLSKEKLPAAEETKEKLITPALLCGILICIVMIVINILLQIFA